MTRLLHALPMLLLAGCQLYGGDDAPPDDGWPGDDLPLCNTDRRAYRIDAIDIPGNTDEAEALGWDLDDDGYVDNQGGNIISAVDSALDVDLQVAVDEALLADLVQIGFTVDECASPDYALISMVRGLELDRLYEPPRMLGDDVTSLAAVATTGLPGVATDSTTQFPVGQLIHPVADDWIDTDGLIMDIEWIDDFEVEGRLIGGVDSEQAMDTVSEAMVAKIIEREEELGPCTEQQCDETLRTLYGVFDDNEDGEVTYEEMRSNSLMTTLLRPDLDLDGDGENESLSIGVGFHAEPIDLYLR